jgi:hypothetical protein
MPDSAAECIVRDPSYDSHPRKRHCQCPARLFATSNSSTNPYGVGVPIQGAAEAPMRQLRSPSPTQAARRRPRLHVIQSPLSTAGGVEPACPLDTAHITTLATVLATSVTTTALSAATTKTTTTTTTGLSYIPAGALPRAPASAARNADATPPNPTSARRGRHAGAHA